MRTRNGTGRRYRPHLVTVLVALLLTAGPVHAKQARATLDASVTVLSSCVVATGQRVATTCTGTTPPTIEHREQGTGQDRVQLTVVTF